MACASHMDMTGVVRESCLKLHSGWIQHCFYLVGGALEQQHYLTGLPAKTFWPLAYPFYWQNYQWQQPVPVAAKRSAGCTLSKDVFWQIVRNIYMFLPPQSGWDWEKVYKNDFFEMKYFHSIYKTPICESDPFYISFQEIISVWTKCFMWPKIYVFSIFCHSRSARSVFCYFGGDFFWGGE